MAKSRQGGYGSTKPAEELCTPPRGPAPGAKKANMTEETTVSDRMTEIAWLRGKVEQLTPDTREGMAQMGECGDLNEGYILALLEAAEHVIAELDRLRAERTAMLDALEAAQVLADLDTWSWEDRQSAVGEWDDRIARVRDRQRGGRP